MPSLGKNRGRDAARSRNTTPMSTASAEQGSAARMTTPVATTWNDLLEMCKTTGTPHSTKLKSILDSVKSFNNVASQRADAHDKGMRECARRKREALERQHEQAMRSRAEEEETERLRQVALQKKELEERPPAVGSHRLAPQDGSPPDASSLNEDADMPDADADANQADSIPRQPRKKSVSSDTSSEAPQSRPPPVIPQYQTFGPDPLKFDDPTIYHIRDWDASTAEEMKKDIFGVASYPQYDLLDLTCGTPLDRDLTNAKPAQQISWATFSSWLDPYFRPISEEDINFLKERGDRSGPMVIPSSGSRSYKEIWAEEDQSGLGDPTSSSHYSQASTGADTSSNPDYTTPEGVDPANGGGPGAVLSRLMQVLRPERRAPPVEQTTGDTTNGDSLMSGIDGDDMSFDLPSIPPPSSAISAPSADDQQASQRPLPPATSLPDSVSLRAPPNRPSWEEMDDRVLAELRYIGFLGPDEKPEFNGHHDDEIAARLRLLQAELQRVSVINGARKARVLELAEDEMARHEWNGIQDDLDNQLNSAYAKRHRNTSKSKGKLKRAGAAAGYSGSMPGEARVKVGDVVKGLMDRRMQWREMLGPAVEYGKREVPADGVFREDDPHMQQLLAAEKDQWDVPDVS